MKHFYPLMIEVDEFKIVELLQNEVAGVIEDVAAFVPPQPIQKHFKADAVMKIFAGMNLETQIDTSLVEVIENGPPTFCEFVECSLYKSGWALWPWIEVWPRQRS